MRYVGALLPHADLERERAKSNVGLATKPRSKLNLDEMVEKWQRACKRSREFEASEKAMERNEWRADGPLGDGPVADRPSVLYTIAFVYYLGGVLQSCAYSGSTHPHAMQLREKSHRSKKGSAFTALGNGDDLAFHWEQPVRAAHL